MFQQTRTTRIVREADARLSFIIAFWLRRTHNTNSYIFSPINTTYNVCLFKLIVMKTKERKYI